ncbi:MAG: MFS transporter, partial [Hyphomicrobiales bacterium]|nr:MFS transporter [Hyphomicrobiales bacterium]
MCPQDPPRPAGQPPDAPRPRLALGGTFVTQMAAAFGFMAFTLLAPGLAAETGLDERDFSLTVTFMFLAAGLTAPFTGRLVRRLGALRTTVTMLAGMAAAVLVVLHGSWWSAMLASFCFGVFYGPFSPTSMTVMMRNAPARRRGLLLAVRHTSVPLAGVVAGRALPPLMLAYGWQLGVLSASGVVLAAALLALALAPAFRLPDI